MCLTPNPGKLRRPLPQGERENLHLEKKAGIRLPACLRMSQYRGGGGGTDYTSGVVCGATTKK